MNEYIFYFMKYFSFLQVLEEEMYELKLLIALSMILYDFGRILWSRCYILLRNYPSSNCDYLDSSLIDWRHLLFHSWISAQTRSLSTRRSKEECNKNEFSIILSRKIKIQMRKHIYWTKSFDYIFKEFFELILSTNLAC